MRHLPEFLFWEAAGTGLWLLTLSSVPTAELVAALLCTLPCAVVAVAARHAVEGSWRPRTSWARWLLPLPLAVLADGVRVLGLAAGSLVGRRIPAGDLYSTRLTRDRDGRTWRARQAAAVGLVTATPGSIVLDIGQQTGDTVVHGLGSGRPRMDEVVRR